MKKLASLISGLAVCAHLWVKSLVVVVVNISLSGTNNTWQLH